ncbi:hypothetical protein EJ419_06205 [Alloscardovia theropitheci]|uniref:3'-5' exonuclease n=1 Tax=Alloscardovia theropitheci TaxID=2496842 RepID=A0A4R0QNR0_9BIFI|nr:hypothetical protein [Alloscardovia theropitheci]TCD53842.1 hypothetical protein EJ419_06205 [Alloscardovia theropitheci]
MTDTYHTKIPLSLEDSAACETPDDDHVSVLHDMEKFMGTDILVGHDITDYVYPQLSTVYDRLLHHPLTLPYIDTLSITHYIFPNWTDYSFTAMLHNLDIDTVSPMSDYHRALYVFYAFEYLRRHMYDN